jgi:hypothetical protein
LLALFNYKSLSDGDAALPLANGGGEIYLKVLVLVRALSVVQQKELNKKAAAPGGSAAP